MGPIEVGITFLLTVVVAGAGVVIGLWIAEEIRGY